jgi:hypothetical protein
MVQPYFMRAEKQSATAQRAVKGYATRAANRTYKSQDLVHALYPLINYLVEK